MGIEFRPLPDLGISTLPKVQINADGKPLRVAVPESVAKDDNDPNLTAAIGVATTLYNWCPDALYAFLDLHTWLSFTWILTTNASEPDETRAEIGRIKNVVTMGLLDSEEHWKLMVSYTISDRGDWIPNTDESMLGDTDVVDPAEVDRLGRSFVKDLILQRAWATGRKIRHDFFIEDAPTDAFSDGIAINPRWLYHGIDLDRCTTCGALEGSQRPTISRCSKCGTASYCSSSCQRTDWPVHKATCNMTMEDRGKALHLAQAGGLVSRLLVADHDKDDGRKERG